jgi:hypothetical protein
MPDTQDSAVSDKNLSGGHAKKEVEYWLGVERESNVESAKCLEEASKQAVTIASLLQGIYFAAISFSDIKMVGKLNDIWFLIFVVLSILVTGFWMACLYYATRVFAPKTYEGGLENSDDLVTRGRRIRDTYNEIVAYKYKNLMRAYRLLWASFLPLAANLVIYLILLPTPPANP